MAVYGLAQPVKGVGRVHLRVLEGKKSNDLILDEVMWAPEKTYNLLLQRKLQALGAKVLGKKNEVVVNMASGSNTAALCPNNLFCVKAECAPLALVSKCGQSSKGARAKLRHGRLGHLSFYRLAQLQPMVTGMKSCSAQEISVAASSSCAACVQSKMVRPSFE